VVIFFFLGCFARLGEGAHRAGQLAPQQAIRLERISIQRFDCQGIALKCQRLIQTCLAGAGAELGRQKAFSENREGEWLQLNLSSDRHLHTMHRALVFSRPLVCGILLSALCIVTRFVALDSEDKDNEVFLESLLNNEAASESPHVKKQSFADWYRQQSADVWFGSATFTQNKGMKKNHKKWLTKGDISSIPAVEREKANTRLKARMVQLSMNMLQQEKKANHLVALLKTKLADEVDANATQPYSPSLTSGDFEDLNSTQVNGIIKDLDFQFQNRTVMSSEDFEKAHEKMTAEQKAAIAKQKRENDAAGDVNVMPVSD
jgi:hypothetical protein